jgi:PleD family two-component response regulator
MAVVLIAAPSPVVSKLKAGLPDHVEVQAAETYDDALARLRERQVDLLIVCYIFDDVRPYRLLNHLQELDEPPPAMLAPLGVREFQNFSDQEKIEGIKVALAQFRELVLRLVRVRPSG